ncbi:MAG: hypothetical protein M3O72_08755 [Verrucomicrobiota bacterium]|nr:hypothetical protein [Verrucomicrobiota bacterium]
MRSDDCKQIPRNWNAQNQFNCHARAEDVDLRDGGEFGAVAEKARNIEERLALDLRGDVRINQW